MNNNVESILFRDETEIFEITMTHGNSGQKWRIGSEPYIPGLGRVPVTRIFIDTDAYLLHGVSRVIVEAELNGHQFRIKSYPIDVCLITYNIDTESILES